MNNRFGYSEQFLRKRKMMLLLPVLFVPAVGVAFYGLGGGSGDGTPRPGEMKGLNMTLPLAKLDGHGQPEDKLGFYEKAKEDSMKMVERRRGDPYGGVSGGVGGSATAGANGVDVRAARADRGLKGAALASGLAKVGESGGVGAARQADSAMARLELLKQMIGKKGEGIGNGSGRLPGVALSGDGMASRIPVESGREMRRPATASSVDPQMERLDGMLDKIMRIQHPEMVRGDSGRAASIGTAVVGVSRAEVAVGNLNPMSDVEEGGFMEIGEVDAGDSVRDAAIEAVVCSSQTLTEGSTVDLRITHAVTVNGREIPANQLAYGVASLSGERLMLRVASLRVGDAILPVDLQVYDLDGLEGIRVPGAITRDVSKESADQALNGLQMASLDPSLSAQATSAGLQFARTLASRKIKLVRVEVPAGYRVLLRNSKTFTK